MTRKELAMEAAKLRLKIRMNNRLKLESQALLSRLFREHDLPIADELLSALVLAVPDELKVAANIPGDGRGVQRQAGPISSVRPGDDGDGDDGGPQPVRPGDEDDDDMGPQPVRPGDEDEDDTGPQPVRPGDEDDDDMGPQPVRPGDEDDCDIGPQPVRPGKSLAKRRGIHESRATKVVAHARTSTKRRK